MDFSIIAPSYQDIPAGMKNVIQDPDQYENKIATIQRFRGQVYLDDKAIPASAINQEGRHYSSMDYKCWHIIIYGSSGEIAGTIRIPVYKICKDITRLMIHNIITRARPEIQKALLKATDEFLAEASLKYLFFTEPGGWAVAPVFRNQFLGAQLASGTMSMLQLLGNAAGFSPTTVKHNAALLLKNIAGFNRMSCLGYPTFYDEYYKCDLEIIFFYSDLIKPDFSDVVASIKKQMESVEVLAN